MLIVSGPAHDPLRKHLHIVCTDPDTDGNVIMVSVNSITNAMHDATCLLMPHEHDFLRHNSYVAYNRASIRSAAAINKGIASGIIIQRLDMNGQSFQKILNGICRSKQTPKKVKKHFGCPEADKNTDT